MSKEMVKALKRLEASMLATMEAMNAIVTAAENESTGDAEATSKKATNKEVEDNDYSNMKSDELYELCKERDIKCKAKAGKAVYIKLLTAFDNEEGQDEEVEKSPKAPKAKKGKVKEVVVEEEEYDEEEEEEGEVDYTKMTAKELFAECKARGIEAAPRKKADEYIKLLVANDEEEDDDDEEWDI